MASRSEAFCIYTPIEHTPEQRQRLRDAAGNCLVHFATDGGPQDRAAFEESEVVFGSVPADWIPTARSLRWSQLDSTGFGHYLHLNWRELGRRVTVTNLAGFFAEPVAETALAGALALYRGIDQLVRLQAQKRWDKLPMRARLRPLRGATVVICGYGSIGRRFEQLLAPFHCRVHSYAPEPAASLRAPAELDGVLPQADLVFVAMPETPDTINLFGAARLDRFKRGALFINVGRGSAVDERALAERLGGGALGGAVLDVTNVEPLPSEHPLWSLPNCLLTQHTAGGTDDELERKIDFFADNLRRYRSGEPLQSVVNWERGF